MPTAFLEVMLQMLLKDMHDDNKFPFKTKQETSSKQMLKPLLQDLVKLYLTISSVVLTLTLLVLMPTLLFR